MQVASQKPATTENKAHPITQIARSELPSKLAIGASISLLLISGHLWHQFSRVRARESVIEVRTITIKSPIEGTILKLDNKSGQRIKAGQTLFQVINNRTPKPRVGDLQIELSTAQAKLISIQQKEERIRRILAEAIADAKNQSSLQINRQQEELGLHNKRRTQALHEAAYAKRHLERRYTLYKQGVITYEDVDRAKTNLEKAREDVRATENQIRSQKQVLEAAKRNLTLIATRGGADPETRLRDTRIMLEEAEDERFFQTLRLHSLSSQLLEAQREYELKKFANIKSPIDGVTYAINLHAGSSVRQQEEVLQLLDCQTRWINTYVRESDIKNIKIGQRAEIRLYGSNKKLSGVVTIIRSGIGRSSKGSDLSPLIPINIYREAQVKVSILDNGTLSEDPARLCYSGYTGKVTFLQ